MNKELKTGLFVVCAITVLVFGINYLKGINILNSHRIFYAVYEDIGGLQVGGAVMVNGYKVGMVSDIKLLVHRNQNLRVTINIEEDFDIRSSTVCKIVNQDLMGTKGVSLIVGNSGDLLESGDTLISDIEESLQEEVNAQILPLKNKAEELIGSIDSVMMIITAVLNQDTRESLRNSFQSIDETFLLMSSTMLKVDSLVGLNDDQISKIIQNLASITASLESNNGDVRTILRNFALLSDSLVQADIAKTISNINELAIKINNGEGNLGLLMKDESLYLNLEKSTRELSELLEDIKQNPSRYVNFSIIGGGKPYSPHQKK